MIADDLDSLDAQQLRERLRAMEAEVAFKQALIDKLTHENALLKRLKFGAQSEKYSPEQRNLLDETFDTDLAALAAEIEAVQPSGKTAGDKQAPKRERLPAHLPRRDIRHEPDNTTCGCGQPMQRIGEDVAEKLDYQPGVFTVERHIRGKWV